MAHFHQGVYVIKNPDKYVGDKTKVYFRSSWEYRLMTFFDTNINILKWASEPLGIPYIRPDDGKVHHYYLDFLVTYRKKDGSIHKEAIEVKPHKQTRPSRSRKERTKLIENVTYAINQAKWEAARQWCDNNGFVFRVITEKELFG